MLYWEKIIRHEEKDIVMIYFSWEEEEDRNRKEQKRREKGDTETPGKNFRKPENALIQPKFMDKMQIGERFWHLLR